MLETVVVLPFLILLLFGLIQFGILFARWIVLSNAAREGARVAIVFRPNCAPATVGNDVVATVQARAAQFGLTVDPTDINVTGACAGPNTNAAVTVDMQFDIGILGGAGLLDLTAGSVMRNEG